MSSSKKRLKTSGGGDGNPRSSPVCIIHFQDSKSDKITLLSDTLDPESRLQRLQDISRKRLGQPLESPQRLAQICSQIPISILPEHGYHRDCYQRFTGKLDRLVDIDSPNTPGTSTGRASKRSSDDKYIFHPDCIFCHSEGRKKIKKGQSWTTEPLTKFEYAGGETVLKAAEVKEDHELLRRIKGYDLFACEAQFHPSCRKRYTTDPELWRSTDADKKLEQQDLEASHKTAYAEVCRIVDETLIVNKGIVKLTSLLEAYIEILEKSPHPNPEYRAEKLKQKLQKSYSSSLSFVQLGNKGKFQSSLVYSSNIEVGSIVRMTYELSNADKSRDVASQLRTDILTTFQQSDNSQWPPTAQHLEETDNVLPEELTKFLRYLVSGRDDAGSRKVNRLVRSFGEDLCRAATNGQWKLPKHILLCMTLRHLYRSAELVTLINRFGHCENYSFSLELETALAISAQESSEMLTSQIVRNPRGESLFHSDFDNFDQNTAFSSIHTAHGIMLQEVEASEKITLPIPAGEKTKRRTLDLYPETDKMPDCYVSTRKSPAFNVTRWRCPEGVSAEASADQSNMLWVFVRWLSSNTGQEVPGWSGFLSVTGDGPPTTTTIDYYPVINSPITEYKTVQECLRYSEQATHEVGQEYVITTFDLGVCMKAFPLVWNSPGRYKKHIVMIGTFHGVGAYLKMLGKKMQGTGLGDILIEAGLITSGSLKGVLAGKQYSRAMTCHKAMLEALERFLLAEFLVTTNRSSLLDRLEDEQSDLVQELLESPSSTSLNSSRTDETLKLLMQEYAEFKEDVRKGKLGKTARLWISYMDHIWLILKVIQAVKHNLFSLYCECLYKMSDLFFSFNGQNYARYLTFFSVFLANIEDSHPGATKLLENGAFSVARSLIPGNRCPVDKTIEETFMKHSKCRGGSGGAGAGLTGLLNNPKAYQKWVRTTHERTQYVEATLSMADMLAESRGSKKHKDLRPAEIKNSEKLVQRAVSAVKSFLNPFDVPDKQKLYCLSSGAPVDSNVEHSVLEAEKIGKEAKEKFVKDRLETKDHFFEPVKRINLKTMSAAHKTGRVKNSKNKIVEFKQQSTVMLNLLVRSQEGSAIDIEDLMTYPLTPVPFSIGTADGFMTKNDKSKGFDYLTKGVDSAQLPPYDTTLIVEDGNALFYYMRELPNNFKEICRKVFDLMGKNCNVVFSTDTYLPNSIKAMERRRRGCGEKLIVQGELTKKPADWKEFLTNDQNKVQLIQLILKIWSSADFATHLTTRNVIVISEGHAYQLQSLDGNTTEKKEVLSLHSSQEETDTRIILYCRFAQDNGYEYVRVRSPDSDVFFILLHYVQEMTITVLFDTGTGNRRRLINMSELAEDFTAEYSTALAALHVFTHCDTTSAFKGVGKVKPIKLLQKNPKFQPILAQLGESWEPSPSLVSGLEEFTCVLYGRKKFTSVDKLRYALIKEKCGSENGSTKLRKNADLSILPPCSRVLLQHIRRANYQMCINRNAHIPVADVPSPTDGHGWQLVDGNLEPLWFDGEIVPPVVVENAGDDNQELTDSENDSEDEASDEDYLPDAVDDDSDSADEF